MHGYYPALTLKTEMKQPGDFDHWAVLTLVRFRFVPTDDYRNVLAHDIDG